MIEKGILLINPIQYIIYVHNTNSTRRVGDIIGIFYSNENKVIE